MKSSLIPQPIVILPGCIGYSEHKCNIITHMEAYRAGAPTAQMPKQRWPTHSAAKRVEATDGCSLACSGVLYLNATPFWAFMPSASDRGITAQILRAIVPYDGVMPAPESLKSLIKRLWWDFFIQESTIRFVLQQVYIDRCTLHIPVHLCLASNLGNLSVLVKWSSRCNAAKLLLLPSGVFRH